ncbi:MAG: hypothetical protein M0R06_01140 [Sphaerochaeta sp.]|nr:hypothetical protein [Sphaerochaeta sp.]
MNNKLKEKEMTFFCKIHPNFKDTPELAGQFDDTTDCPICLIKETYPKGSPEYERAIEREESIK